MSCPQRFRCRDCNDRLIHQNNRGPHEASSGLLQWVHDRVPRTMDVVDDDLEPGGFDVVRRRIRPPAWRRVEHKPHGGRLRDSQEFLLPTIAIAIDEGITTGRLDPRSGVFVVYSDPPYESGKVAWVPPIDPLAMGPCVALSGKEWKWFWVVGNEPAGLREGAA